jgi:hypothetical protein
MAVHKSKDGEKGSNDEVRPHRTNRCPLKQANNDNAMYDSDEGSPPVTNSHQPKSTTKA